MTELSSRYQARGVSADKKEVHRVVDNMDKGLFPNAFCKLSQNILTPDEDRCVVIHADGSGTKSIIAYLYYQETGDANIFKGIAQDSIVMNLDDLLCVGVTDGIIISSTINRHAKRCPGDVLSALIEGNEEFLQQLRDLGVGIHSGGGETADVGDLTATVVVDSCAVALPKKQSVLDNSQIKPGLSIVGFASDGQASYEKSLNSGIGSNGLTSARHDLLSPHYRENYPESYTNTTSTDLVYCGPYRLHDQLPDSKLTVGSALLSPTRTYAPIMHTLFKEYRNAIKGAVHCSGGGQTKCLRFAQGVHFYKEQVFTPPAIFQAIQRASAATMEEMYQVFNMGHRMEVYCEPAAAPDIIAVASSYGVAAQQIGEVRESETGTNHLSIKTADKILTYSL